MAGSGRRALAGALAGAMLVAGLGGCVSTQHKNARAQLVAQRTLAGRRPLRILARSRAVRVLGVAVVRERRRGAFVVTLRNRGARALADVPIAVGVRAGGRRVQLNGGRGLTWFQTHVPAIGAGERTTWVLVARRPLPVGPPWAAVGRAHAVQAVPRLGARVGEPAGHGAARVALENRSDVPQYGLQVYAVARRHGRVVAAGATTVVHLGSHGTARARVPLVGAPDGRAISVHAPATIFD